MAHLLLLIFMTFLIRVFSILVIIESFITLIPKLKNHSHIKNFLTSFSKFRLIGLSFFFLDLFPNSHNQNAFVKGRYVFDSILISNEIFHSFRYKIGSSYDLDGSENRFYIRFIVD